MRIATGTYHAPDEQQRTRLAATLYNIIFTNDTCCGEVFEAITALRKSPWYSGKVKFWAKKVVGYLKEYDRVLEKATKAIDYVADINEEFSDLIKSDMVRLRMTTLNYMNKCGVPNARLVCQVEMANIFCMGALHNMDFIINRQSDIHREVVKFKFLRLGDLVQAYRHLAKEVEKLCDGDYICDLNANEDIYNGFVVVTKKLSDPETIFRIIDKIDRKYGK